MKAILFDLFGTLVPNLPSATWETCSDAIASTLDIDPILYRQLSHNRFKDRMTGKVADGDNQFDSILEEARAETSREARREAARLNRELLGKILVAKPETLETLDEIQSRGLKLGLITDCSTSAPELLDETPLGKYFEARSISAYLGVRKPDSKMYHHCIDLLGVAASDCIYVGDGNSEELVGARRCGMTTVWVDNLEEQHWHERFVPDGDHTVNFLTELLPIIDSYQKGNEK